MKRAKSLLYTKYKMLTSLSPVDLDIVYIPFSGV